MLPPCRNLVATFASAKDNAPRARNTAPRHPQGGASEPSSQTRLGELLGRPPADPGQYIEENEHRFTDCQTFLEQFNVLLKLLRYRRFMQVFADARSHMMQRTGQDWELSQAKSLLDTGSRSYRFTKSFEGAKPYPSIEYIVRHRRRQATSSASKPAGRTRPDI